MEIPEIRYAPAGDLSIAYQRFGSGPELMAVPPFAQNIEVMWEDGQYRHLLERISSFATLTHFDKRGTGLSDRTIGAPALEERMDDFRAVMDHVGLERASLVGVSEGGAMAVLFAATFPERVDKLILYGTFAAMPWFVDPALDELRGLVQAWVDQLADGWGTPESISIPSFMPSMVGDDAYARWMQRYERNCLSPKSVRELMRLNIDIDVREALPLVQAPTLVMHRTGDVVVDVSLGRHLAEQIDHATFVELSGVDHVPWCGDVDALVDELEEFIVGGRSVPIDTNRVLATVLFTDIVGSTDRASAIGDRAWRALLDRHDAAMRDEITRHSGRVIKTTGDGFLATFDSPGRAVRAAKDMVAAGQHIDCEIRAGLHTGEVELRDDDVAGMAVHIGARVAAIAAANEVLVSSTVRDLVIGSELRFDDRGTHTLKGVAGDWRLLSLAN